MHPSDENQASFKQPGARPNLMSSTRRGSHEDSILARLDGDPGARGASGARLAWYGTAALIAVGLTATLAWLAAGTGQPALELARAGDVKVVKPQVVVPQVVTPAARIPVPTPTPTPPPPARMGSAAVVVDAPATTLPEPAPAPLHVPAPAAPAGLAALVTIPAKSTPPRTAPPARARPPATRPPARQASRVARASGDTTVDSDVALISAVIYHANGHAAAQDEAASACSDDSCRPRPAR